MKTGRDATGEATSGHGGNEAQKSSNDSSSSGWPDECNPARFGGALKAIAGAYVSPGTACLARRHTDIAESASERATTSLCARGAWPVLKAVAVTYCLAAVAYSQSIIYQRRQTKYSSDETNYDVERHHAVPIARCHETSQRRDQIVLIGEGHPVRPAPNCCINWCFKCYSTRWRVSDVLKELHGNFVGEVDAAQRNV